MRLPLALLLLLIAGCGSPECGENVKVGPDADPFAPYCSGDTLQVTGTAGSFGLPLAFEIRELDGTQSTTAVIRLTYPGEGSEDSIGGVALRDDGGGLFTTNTFVTLQDQTQSAIEARDGSDVQFSAAFTAGDVTQEVILDLVLAAP